MNHSSLVIIGLAFVAAVACNEKRQQFTSKKNNSMSYFASIDNILNDFAASRNAKINEIKSGYSVGGITVPESDDRRILWEDGEIGKAILIQPNFDSKDLNIKSWNLQILAWKLNVKPGTGETPFWNKIILKQAPLDSIKNNINVLLDNSVEALNRVKVTDLKP